MGKDRRSIRAGHRVLLVAMAIQGLTPDYGSLASPWLLRFVAAGWPGDQAAGGGPTPLLAPVHGGEHDGAPGEVCSNVAAESAPRVRLDKGGRLCAHLISIGLLERPTRSVPRPPSPTGVGWRWSDGLIPSLCQFRC